MCNYKEEIEYEIKKTTRAKNKENEVLYKNKNNEEQEKAFKAGIESTYRNEELKEIPTMETEIIMKNKRPTINAKI